MSLYSSVPAGVRPAVHGLALAAYAGFALILFFPILSRPTTAYIGGEPGPAQQDPQSFMWFLMWMPYALSHHLNPLLTNWIFSDSGANLAWNTAVPFVGVVMAPVTLSAGPISSYNLALVLSLVVSAWAAYCAAVRVFRCGFLPALLAGAVYGFSPFETAHAVGHLHMTPAFTPPLFLLVLHDVVVIQRSPTWLNGAKLASLALIQYFISAEVLLMEVILAAIAVATLMISRRRAVTPQRVRYGAAALSYAALMAAPFLAYPVYLTFFGPWQPSHPIHGVTDSYAATVLSFVVPTSAQALFGSWFLSTSVTGGEWNTYLGLPLIVVLWMIGRERRDDAVIRFLLVLLGAIIVLAMGSSLHLAGNWSTGIPLPWRVFRAIPLFRDVTENRTGEYLYLSVGLILARYLADGAVTSRCRAVRVAAVVAALVFLFPRVPLYPATPVAVPDFFRLPRDTSTVASPALVLPFSSDIATERATAMLWQAEARMAFKMPEGYAFGQGRAPWPHPTPLSQALLRIEAGGRGPILTPVVRADIVETIGTQHIRTILLGPSPHARDEQVFLTSVLGWGPDPVDGVLLWRDVERRLSSQRTPPGP